MAMNNIIRLAFFSLLFLAITVAFSACGASYVPEDREIELAISEGKFDSGTVDIDVNQGDTVTFLIESDERGTFHLHGYDIEKEVGPGDTTTMEFEARATGRFPITYHASGEEGHEGSHESNKQEHEEGSEEGEHEEEGDEVTLGALEVRPR